MKQTCFVSLCITLSILMDYPIHTGTRNMAFKELPVKISIKLEMMFMKHYAPNPLLVKKDGNLL